MAVVFISPKQRQRTFFVLITAVFLVFLLVIFFAVFLVSPQSGQQQLVFNKPKVTIDMGVFNSDQFKNLQPFSEMTIKYSYSAVDKNNKTQTGFISAVSEEKARTFLTDTGLTVLDLKEVEVGRDNPFAPYYQQ